MAHGDGAAVEGDDSGIGDGDPVGVAGEVADDGLGSVEGPLGVDIPLDRARLAQHGLEGLAVGEVGDGAVEGEIGLRQVLEEAVAEEACQDADRGEEVGGARLPRPGVDVEAAVGDEAVEVGMPFHLLVPGVQHGGAAD